MNMVMGEESGGTATSSSSTAGAEGSPVTVPSVSGAPETTDSILSSASDSEAVDDEAQKEIRTTAKSYPHVPPRVDPESYQAELPELLTSFPQSSGREGK
jgi:hypothetical protein